MAEPQPPYPLLPPLSLLNDQARSALPINLEVLQRLEATPEHLHSLQATWRTGVDFLVRESANPYQAGARLGLSSRARSKLSDCDHRKIDTVYSWQCPLTLSSCAGKHYAAGFDLWKSIHSKGAEIERQPRIRADNKRENSQRACTHQIQIRLRRRNNRRPATAHELSTRGHLFCIFPCLIQRID